MQNIVFGLITGSVIAIASVGLALVRATERFINVAHGQMLAGGAYLGVVLRDSYDMNIFLAGLIATIAVGALGVVAGRLVFDPVREKGGTVLLFTSIGLAQVLQAIMIVAFGTKIRVYTVSFGGLHRVGGVTISTGEVVIVGVAALSVVALQLFMRRTTTGRSIRSVASNPDLAQVRGISTRRVSAVVWFVSSSMAGLAGVMLGTLTSVHPETGWNIVLIILAAAVLGGIASLVGVLAAGLVLGLAMDVSALWINTSYRSVVAFALLVLVLLVKPEGLFAARRRPEVAT